MPGEIFSAVASLLELVGVLSLTTQHSRFLETLSLLGNVLQLGLNRIPFSLSELEVAQLTSESIKLKDLIRKKGCPKVLSNNELETIVHDLQSTDLKNPLRPAALLRANSRRWRAPKLLGHLLLAQALRRQ